MTASLEPMDERANPVARPPESALRRFVEVNRAALGTLAVFVVMIAIFMAASPSVFLHWPIYDSVLVTLPVALCLVVPLVFVVTVGEIDLSFPATMGFSAWTFALVVHAGLSPFLGIVAALATGMALGACVGALVVTAGLSSLIATLGMNYMLRGFIMIVTQGKSIALLELQDTTAGTLFSSQVYGFPVQVFWALGFVVFSALLYNRHRFGARVKAVGDNPDSAAQMGIDVIVDFRGLNLNQEKREAAANNMKLILLSWDCRSPSDKIAADFLQILKENPGKKIFVHCYGGIDRTGAMIAVYRMANEGWTEPEAMNEMHAFGYAFMHRIWCRAVDQYVKKFPQDMLEDPQLVALHAGAAPHAGN